MRIVLYSFKGGCNVCWNVIRHLNHPFHDGHEYDDGDGYTSDMYITH